MDDDVSPPDDRPSIARAALVAALLLLVPLGVSVAWPDLVARHVVPFFLYHPGASPVTAVDPAAAGLPGGQDVRIVTSDGVELHAWWVPADPAAAGSGASRSCGSVVHFHGNAGSLVGRAFVAEEFSRRGFDALLVDYRGYGRSAGSPDERGLRLDARAALDWVREEAGTPPARTVVAGHSLGAAVAGEVAAGRELGAAVLTGAFTSVPGIARHHYGWLPDAMFRGWSANVFDLASRVDEISAPVFVARGTEDGLVPGSETRRVFEAARPPKHWYRAPGAGHNDLWSHEGFWRELEAFLRDALGCAPAGPGAGRADGRRR